MSRPSPSHVTSFRTEAGFSRSTPNLPTSPVNLDRGCNPPPPPTARWFSPSPPRHRPLRPAASLLLRSLPLCTTHLPPLAIWSPSRALTASSSGLGPPVLLSLPFDLRPSSRHPAPHPSSPPVPPSLSVCGSHWHVLRRLARDVSVACLARTRRVVLRLLALTAFAAARSALHIHVTCLPRIVAGSALGAVQSIPCPLRLAAHATGPLICRPFRRCVPDLISLAWSAPRSCRCRRL